MLTLNVYFEGTTWYEIRITMIRYSDELIQIKINTTISTIQKNKNKKKQPEPVLHVYIDM